ncbi:MAG: WecB/TagA/CpsF family glycosyltransferase [Minicystis sp.]
MSATTMLLPRAPLRDVLLGRAPLVGSRCDPAAPRGLVSPIEARIHLGLRYEDPVEEERRRLARTGPRETFSLVLRTALAETLWPSGGKRPLQRPFIVSTAVDNITVAEALEAVFTRRVPGRATMIHFVHPHALTLAAFDREHAGLLERADLRLPDGVGLRLAAALLDVQLADNVNGTDLLPLLCREAARRHLPMVLIGGAPGVAARCAARLVEGTPELAIAFTEHGYHDDDASRAVAERVRALGRAVVLVGMGSPVQERWAWRHLASAEDAAVLTVGGLFDFYSGRIPRAPEAVRELGLEWAHRLAQEPRRLGKRYLLGNPLFVALVLTQRLRGPEP